jgi:hypothetical protein
MKPEGKRKAQPENLGELREARLREWKENDAGDELVIPRIQHGQPKVRRREIPPLRELRVLCG